MTYKKIYNPDSGENPSTSTIANLELVEDASGDRYFFPMNEETGSEIHNTDPVTGFGYPVIAAGIGDQGTIPNWFVSEKTYNISLSFSLIGYVAGETWNLLEGNDNAVVSYRDDIISVVSESGTMVQFAVSAIKDSGLNRMNISFDDTNVTMTFNGYEQVDVLPHNKFDNSENTTGWNNNGATTLNDVIDTLNPFGGATSMRIYSSDGTPRSNTLYKGVLGTPNSICTFSYYAKQLDTTNGRFFVYVDGSSLGGADNTGVDLITGVPTDVNGHLAISSHSENVGNGWIRGGITIRLDPADGHMNFHIYKPDGVDMLFYGMQLVEGYEMLPYTPSLGTPAALPYSPFQYNKVGTLSTNTTAHISDWGMTDYEPLSGRDIIEGTGSGSTYARLPVWGNPVSPTVKIVTEIPSKGYDPNVVRRLVDFRTGDSGGVSSLCYVYLGHLRFESGVVWGSVFINGVQNNATSYEIGVDVPFDTTLVIEYKPTAFFGTGEVNLGQAYIGKYGNVELIDNSPVQDRWVTKASSPSIGGDTYGKLPNIKLKNGYIKFRFKAIAEEIYASNMLFSSSVVSYQSMSFRSDQQTLNWNFVGNEVVTLDGNTVETGVSIELEREYEVVIDFANTSDTYLDLLLNNSILTQRGNAWIADFEVFNSDTNVRYFYPLNEERGDIFYNTDPVTGVGRNIIEMNDQILSSGYLDTAFNITGTDFELEFDCKFPDDWDSTTSNHYSVLFSNSNGGIAYALRNTNGKSQFYIGVDASASIEFDDYQVVPRAGRVSHVKVTHIAGVYTLYENGEHKSTSSVLAITTPTTLGEIGYNQSDARIWNVNFRSLDSSQDDHHYPLNSLTGEGIAWEANANLVFYPEITNNQGQWLNLNEATDKVFIPNNSRFYALDSNTEVIDSLGGQGLLSANTFGNGLDSWRVQNDVGTIEVVDGELVYNNSPNNVEIIADSVEIIPGETYVVTYEVTDYSGTGNFRAVLGGVSGNNRTSTGVFVQEFTAVSANPFTIRTVDVTSGAIDNIQIYRKTDGEWVGTPTLTSKPLEVREERLYDLQDLEFNNKLSIYEPISSTTEWTPIFSASNSTVGELFSDWKPSGVNWDMSTTLYIGSVSGIQSSGTDLTPRLNVTNNSGTLLTSTNDQFNKVAGTVSVGDYITVLNSGGTTRSIYVDGVLSNSYTVDSSTGAYQIVIGEQRSSLNIPRYPWEGQIQRVQLLDPLDGIVNGRNVVSLDGTSQYGEVPVWSATNGVIEFDLFANQFNAYVFDARSVDDDNVANTGLFLINNTSGTLNTAASGYNAVYLDGVLAQDNVTVVPLGSVVKVRIEFSTLHKFRFFGSRFTLTQFLNGFIVNLRLTDLDNPSNSRFYKLDDNLTLVDDLEDYPEEIINGDFSDGTNSWDIGRDAVLSEVSGRLRVTNTVQISSFATQTFAAETGKAYILKVSVYTGTRPWDLRVGNGPGANNYYREFSSGDKDIEVLVIPTGTNFSVSLYVNGGVDGDYCEFDNVSVKQTNQGEWINSPSKVFRDNNSIDISTVKQSENEPDSSNISLINILGGIGGERMPDADFETGIGSSATSWVWNGPGEIESTSSNALYGYDVKIEPYETVVYELVIAEATGQVSINYNNGNVAETFNTPGVYSGEFQQADYISSYISLRSDSSGNKVSRFSIKKDTRDVGEIQNLEGYQPVLKGGGLDREVVEFKSEAFNGDLSTGDFTLGMNTDEQEMATTGTREGVSSGIERNDILVAKNGAVVKVVEVEPGIIEYSHLQGDDSKIQEGFEYPNVYRVLQDDGVEDNSSEYYYYNNGSGYPYQENDGVWVGNPLEYIEPNTPAIPGHWSNLDIEEDRVYIPNNSRFYPLDDNLTVVDTLGDGSTDGTWSGTPTLNSVPLEVREERLYKMEDQYLASVDPLTGEYENLMTWSEEMSGVHDQTNMKWSDKSVGTTQTIANFGPSPDGEPTSTLLFGGDDGNTWWTQDVYGLPEGEIVYTFSVWVKRTEDFQSLVKMFIGGSGAGNYNITNSNLPLNVWQRVSVTRSFDRANTSYVRCVLNIGINNSIEVWGAQLSRSSGAITYQKREEIQVIPDNLPKDGTWLQEPTLEHIPNNTFLINNIIDSTSMPTSTDILDQDGNVIGEWNNLHPRYPYVPVLTNDEAYLGTAHPIPVPLLNMPLEDSIDYRQGSGTPIFDRGGSDKHVFNSDGSYTYYGPDVPAFKDGMYYSEPSSENECLYSEDFTQAYWTRAACTVAPSINTAPDGTMTATTITNDSSGNHSLRRSDHPHVVGTRYTFSVHVKQVGLETISRLAIFDDVFARVIFLTFDYSNPSTVSINDSQEPDAAAAGEVTSLENGWYRLELRYTAYDVNHQMYLRTGEGNGTHDAQQDTWGWQFEEGPVATSYIPTSGSAVTRGEDQLSVTSENIPNDSDFTADMLINLDYIYPDSGVRYFYRKAGNPNSWLRYQNIRPSLNVSHGFNNVTHGGEIFVNTTHQVSSIYNKEDNTITALFDGSIGNPSIDSSTPINSISDITIGWDSSNGSVHGTLGSFKAFEEVLTVDEIAKTESGNGVSTKYQTLSSYGSNNSNINFLNSQDNIFVATNGVVIKIDEIIDQYNAHYEVLQGDNKNVSAGFGYPVVFRNLSDIGGVDNNDEYYYYNNGGTYPWPGDVSVQAEENTSAYGQLDSIWTPTGADWNIEFTAFYEDNEFRRPLLGLDLEDKMDLVWETNNALQVVDSASSPFIIDAFGERNFNTYSLDSSDDAFDVPTYEFLGSFDDQSDFFKGQLHNIKITDTNDNTNSIEIDTVIESETMPHETEIYNKTDESMLGEWKNLKEGQPYVPVLQGGGIFRDYVDGKFEAFSGDFTGNGFIDGIDVEGNRITSLENNGAKGYYYGKFTGSEDAFILVAKTGAVIRTTEIESPYTTSFEVLQNEQSELDPNENIKQGFGYPAVYRILTPTTDPNSEYYYYNDLGGKYPWKPSDMLNPTVYIPMVDSLDMEFGQGTLNYERESSATYVDKATGLIKAADVNIPRFESKGYLTEGRSTNSHLYSQNISEWNGNVGSPVITLVESSSPSGADAYRVTNNGSNDAVGHFQFTNLTTSTATASIFLKNVNSTATRLLGGNTSSEFTVDFNWNGQEITNIVNGSPTALNIQVDDYANGWKRIQVNYNVIDTISKIEVYPDTTDSNKSVMVWGAQIETLDFASSYIPTTTQPVTREADRLTLTATGNLDKDVSTQYAKISSYINPANDSFVSSADSGNGVERLQWNMTDDNRIRSTVFAGGVDQGSIDSAPASIIKGETYEIARVFDIGVNEHKNYLDKVLQGTQNPLISPAITTINIGHRYFYLNPWWGHIKDFQIYDVALTDEEVELLPTVTGRDPNE